MKRQNAREDYSLEELKKVDRLDDSITLKKKDELMDTIIVKTQGFKNLEEIKIKEIGTLGR